MPALKRLARTISRQMRHGSPMARRRHSPTPSRLGRAPHGVGVGAVVGGILRAVRGASAQGRGRPHRGRSVYRTRHW